MSDSSRIITSVARTVALAALVSAPLTLAHAQTKATPNPVPAPTTSTRSTAANPEMDKGIEQRITQLHAELKITPDQESKWNSVAQAMRDNAGNMDKLIAQHKQQGPTNMTAVDELDANQQFAQVHLDGLKNFTSAFKSLYDAMSDPQKKNADQVFAKMNRAPQNGAANRNG